LNKISKSGLGQHSGYSVIGILTDIMPDCTEDHINISSYPAFGWSKSTVKSSKGSGGVAPRLDFFRKLIKFCIKASFLDLLYEVQKYLHEVFA
jgi:hypothetical protein